MSLRTPSIFSRLAILFSLLSLVTPTIATADEASRERRLKKRKKRPSTTRKPAQRSRVKTRRAKRKAKGARKRPRKTRHVEIYLPGSVKKSRVAYQIIGGYAVTDGDILLGDPKTLTQRYGKIRVPGRIANVMKKSGSRGGSVISREDYLWPNGKIPFLIGQSVHDHRQARAGIRKIRAAAKHLNKKTVLKLVEIKSPADADNYIEFVWSTDPELCASSLGMQGGRQTIVCNFTRSDIGKGTVVHEILHAAGFNHTQKRTDRDAYITINPNNTCPGQFAMAPDTFADYCKARGAHDTQGPYDIKSILHYSSTQCPVMNDAGNQILEYSITDKQGKRIKSNRRKLTKLDIKMVNEVYTHLPSTSRSDVEFECSEKYLRVAGKRVVDAGGGWEPGKDGTQSPSTDTPFCPIGEQTDRAECRLGTFKKAFARLPKNTRKTQSSWCYLDKAQGDPMVRLMCPTTLKRLGKKKVTYSNTRCTSSKPARKTATAKFWGNTLTFCTAAFFKLPTTTNEATSSDERAAFRTALARYRAADQCKRGQRKKAKRLRLQNGKTIKGVQTWSRGACPYWYDTSNGGLYRRADEG